MCCEPFTRFPDSPVRTLQRCPGIWASGEGLGVKDHLRLTRCSCPWELLRGWMSTCSCPSWMRPTCPEREKQTLVILIQARKDFSRTWSRCIIRLWAEEVSYLSNCCSPTMCQDRSLLFSFIYISLRVENIIIPVLQMRKRRLME